MEKAGAIIGRGARYFRPNDRVQRIRDDSRMTGTDGHGEVFRRYYEDETSVWGGHSGGGSMPYWTLEYRAFLERFISLNNIRSIVDIGCGDWQFSRFINFTGIEYHGFDVVESVIRRNQERYSAPNVHFEIMPEDFNRIPNADLLIMKDVLQHLSNDDIFKFKNELFFRFPKNILTNSYRKLRIHNYDLSSGDYTTGHNYDIAAGDFRCLDLNDDPFNFGGSYVLEFSSPLFEQIRTLLYIPSVKDD